MQGGKHPRWLDLASFIRRAPLAARGLGLSLAPGLGLRPGLRPAPQLGRGPGLRPAPGLGSALALAPALALALALAGCVPLGFQRPQDVSVPREYRSALQPHELCVPEVEVVRSITQANRPYREVANLSALCYPGAPSQCERRLLERACQLKADAIILTESKTGGTPLGGTTDSRVSRSAIAVRWSEPPPLTSSNP